MISFGIILDTLFY